MDCVARHRVLDSGSVHPFPSDIAGELAGERVLGALGQLVPRNHATLTRRRSSPGSCHLARSGLRSEIPITAKARSSVLWAGSPRRKSGIPPKGSSISVQWTSSRRGLPVRGARFPREGEACPTMGRSEPRKSSQPPIHGRCSQPRTALRWRTPIHKSARQPGVRFPRNPGRWTSVGDVRCLVRRESRRALGSDRQLT